MFFISITVQLNTVLAIFARSIQKWCRFQRERCKTVRVDLFSRLCRRKEPRKRLWVEFLLETSLLMVAHRLSEVWFKWDIPRDFRPDRMWLQQAVFSSILFEPSLRIFHAFVFVSCSSNLPAHDRQLCLELWWHRAKWNRCLNHGWGVVLWWCCSMWQVYACIPFLSVVMSCHSNIVKNRRSEWDVRNMILNPRPFSKSGELPTRGLSRHTIHATLSSCTPGAGFWGRDALREFSNRKCAPNWVRSKQRAYVYVHIHTYIYIYGYILRNFLDLFVFGK